MKCPKCDYVADPACINCGEQCSGDEADPIDGLSKAQKAKLAKMSRLTDLDGLIQKVSRKISCGGLETQVRFLLENGLTFTEICRYCK